MKVKMVSVEVDSFLAECLVKSARKGAFGVEAVKLDLSTIVRFLLRKAILAEETKLRRKKWKKEKLISDEQLKRNKEAIARL